MLWQKLWALSEINYAECLVHSWCYINAICLCFFEQGWDPGSGSRPPEFKCQFCHLLIVILNKSLNLSVPQLLHTVFLLHSPASSPSTASTCLLSASPTPHQFVGSTRDEFLCVLGMQYLHKTCLLTKMNYFGLQPWGVCDPVGDWVDCGEFGVYRKLP